MKKNKDKVWEWCPHCDEEVELDAVLYTPQICPNCGVSIRPCAMCTGKDRANNCRNCKTEDRK